MTTISIDATTTASVRLTDDTIGAETAAITITTGDATVALEGPLRSIYRLIIDIDQDLARIVRPA